MKNQRKFLSSKWERIVAGLLVALVVVFAVIGVCQYLKKQESIKFIEDMENKINSDFNNELNTKTPVLNETDYFNKLSGDSYEINKEEQKISFTTGMSSGSFCISSNPEQPDSSDEWYDINPQNEYKLSDEDAKLLAEDNSINKVYIYYSAAVVSTMTTFNTSADVYTISTANELRTFATKVNSGTDFSGKKVVLLNDITADIYFVPIGKSLSYPFRGTFDGRFNIVSGLNMPDSDEKYEYEGLFGATDAATVKNIIVQGTTIGGANNQSTGAVIGYAKNSVIENCINENINIIGNISTGRCSWILLNEYYLELY